MAATRARWQLAKVGSNELGHALWDRLLAAKTEPEARLCKTAYGYRRRRDPARFHRRGGAIGFTTAADDEKKPPALDSYHNHMRYYFLPAIHVAVQRKRKTTESTRSCVRTWSWCAQC